MQLKKIAAYAAALALGTFAAFPSEINDLGGIAITASAAENGFVIRTDDDGFRYVADYTGNGGAVKLPKNIDYVGKEAFIRNENITSLSVPANCTLICENAFAACKNLKTVTFEGDVEAISSGAFLSCPSLESVIFKGNVHSIYNDSENFYGGIFHYSFAACAKLKTVSFAENSTVDFIGEFAFAYDYSLTSVKLPKNIQEIQCGAFANCENLSQVTIPASLDYIDSYAFGYMFDEDSQKWYRARGNNTLKIQALEYNSQKDEYAFAEKIIAQKQITLTVAKGSKGEEYARGYDINYKYSASEKLAAPVSLTASAGTGKVTLTWDKVADAAAYRVYIYDPSTESYEKYKDVSGEQCTVSGLKSGKKYRFKVAALDKSGGKYKAGKKSESVSAAVK